MQLGHVVVHRRLHRHRGHLLLVGDIHQQHRVVSGQRPAGFGDDVGLRQAVLGTLLLQGLHDMAGIVAHPIVHGAIGPGVGAFIIHPQAAAHIHGLHRRAQGAHLGVVTGRFAHARLDVLDIGHLGAQVKMQQLHAIQPPGGTAVLDGRHQLRRTQAELGLLAPGVLPVTLADAHQPHPQADARRHAQLVRQRQQRRQLGHLLHHDMHVKAQLLAHQRQAQVFRVLVAVADDGIARVGQGQHGQQLRLGARLQADALAVFTGAQNLVHHPALLVHLDRIHRRIAALIVVALNGLPEGPGQQLHPLAKNPGKTRQYRGPQPGRPAAFQHRFQRGLAALLAIGPHTQLALVVDSEVAVAPAIHVVDVAGGQGRSVGHYLS